MIFKIFVMILIMSLLIIITIKSKEFFNVVRNFFRFFYKPVVIVKECKLRSHIKGNTKDTITDNKLTDEIIDYINGTLLKHFKIYSKGIFYYLYGERKSISSTPVILCLTMSSDRVKLRRVLNDFKENSLSLDLIMAEIIELERMELINLENSELILTIYVGYGFKLRPSVYKVDKKDFI